MKTLTELNDYGRLLGAQIHCSLDSTAITVQMPQQRRQIQSGQTGDFICLPVTAPLQQNIDEAFQFMKDWEERWGLKNELSKKEIKAYIQKRLHEDKQAVRTLILIFNKQTATEQQAEATTLHNNVGFTGVDAKILTSFAKQYQTRGFLSPKQMTLLKKKIVKYWEQVIDEAVIKGNELVLLRQVKADKMSQPSLQLTMRFA